MEKKNRYWPWLSEEEKGQFTDQEKLALLIENIKAIVPYVNATIAPNNSFEPGSLIGAHDPSNTKDWMAIHKGRAGSSHNQLTNLLKMATEMGNAGSSK